MFIAFNITRYTMTKNNFKLLLLIPALASMMFAMPVQSYAIPTFTDSFGVSSQEASPQALAFNNDGTKMYVVGSNSGTVFEYNLITAFDVTTASFTAGDFFSVRSQEYYPTAVSFNNGGTKMYVVGSNSGTVFEYNLITAFDVTTASFTAGDFFSVRSQEANPQALAFNNDGTKMYVVGSNSDTVFEYNLITAFDVTTASFASGDIFSVSSQEAYPTAVSFNNGGTKMYVVGSNSDTVFEYDLTTAFDVTTASFTAGDFFSVSSQEAYPTAVSFNNGGTKMYVVGSNSDTVHEYYLDVPFAIAESTITGSADTTGNVFIQSVDTCGIGLGSGAPISYGAISQGETSAEQTLVIQNTGNVNATAFLSGSAWIDSSNSTIINIDNTRYSSSSGEYSAKTQLSVDDVSFMVIQPTRDTNTFWQLEATLLDSSFSGSLTQTVNFVATC